MLSEEQIDRYTRQFVLSDWSTAFQTSLRDISVAIPAHVESAARYLVAAGIGGIKIISEDTQAKVKLEEELKDFDPEVNTAPSSVKYLIHLKDEQPKIAATFRIEIDLDGTIVLFEGEEIIETVTEFSPSRDSLFCGTTASLLLLNFEKSRI
jgi:hypothetical protein